MATVRQVFFNSDARGFALLAVALHSLLKNAAPDRPLTVYIACGLGFREQGLDKRLLEIAADRPFARLVFLDFDPLAARHADLFRSDKWSPLLWAFPLCTELLPDDVHGNLVYLDIDMLIRKDLEELYSLSLAAEGCIAAAVNESRRETRPHLVASGWPEEAGYGFSNAPLVIDVDAYRRENIPAKIIAWYEAHKDTSLAVDQDAENVIFGTRTKRIPIKWNYPDGWLERLLKCPPWKREWRVHPRREVLEAILDPCIIHYVGGRKPTGRTHRPERKAHRRIQRELGLMKGRLPGGQGWREELEGTVFDIYHALLRLYARALLFIVRRTD
ncbi:MAG: hypothetical protein KBT68_03835 [bacterium]|nr:hypothetical protein [Candidatus Colisoma equi]